MNIKVSLVLAAVAALVCPALAAPRARTRRGLGLIKLGWDSVNRGTGGLLAGVTAGVSDSIAGLSTASKIKNGLVYGPGVALGLVGKYALYDWIRKGANAGVQADLGLGPLEVGAGAGLETVSSAAGADGQKFGQIGDYWYEPLSGGSVGEDIPLLAEDTDGGWEVVEDGSTQVGSPFFGVQGGVALGPVKLSAGVGAGR